MNDVRLARAPHSMKKESSLHVKHFSVRHGEVGVFVSELREKRAPRDAKGAVLIFCELEKARDFVDSGANWYAALCSIDRKMHCGG